jgi:hypothetical protein
MIEPNNGQALHRRRMAGRGTPTNFARTRARVKQSGGYNTATNPFVSQL